MASPGVPPTKDKPRKPHHPLVVQKKTHDEFNYHVLAVGSFTSHIAFRGIAFVPHSRPPFIPFVHFISPTSAPHGLCSSLISTPQATFIRSLPKPFSNATPMVCLIFCDEFTPLKPLWESGMSFITPNNRQ